jgi:hypothetical protein
MALSPSFKKHLGSVLIIALVTVLLAESLAHLFLSFSHLKPQEPFFETYDRVLQEQLTQGVYSKWRIIPHPYFGYVYSSNVTKNYYGLSTQADLRSPKKNDEIVVGVFGGSVAEQWATKISQSSYFGDELKKRVPAFRNKKIVVVNFALAAGKQPQQFHLYSTFMDRLDFSINLDGYNEIAFVTAQFPVEYPVYSGMLFFPTRKTENLLDQLRAIVRNRWSLAGFLDMPLVRSSSLGYWVWLAYFNWSEKKRDEISAQIGKSTTDDRADFYADISSDEMRRLGAKNWAKYLRLQNELATADGKPAFFFIQANQFTSASKPFSKEEQAFYESGHQTFVPMGYRYLREFALPLKKSGTMIFDLTDMFRGHPEQVYSDNCCHLNAHGMDIETDRILDLIVPKLIPAFGN